MDLYDILEKLNIDYKEISHKAVFSVDEANAIKESIDGVGCKNLFLTNKKGAFYLLLLKDDKKADLRKIRVFLNESHLSFADENKLKEILALEKGSVSPLAIINDKKNLVKLIIDKSLKGSYLLVHPNKNTKTISIFYDDLIKFIEFEGNEYFLV